MSSVFAGIPDTAMSKTITFTLNLSQAAGTYDAGTVSGGAIMLTEAIAYVTVAAATLTSVSIQTNISSPVTIMSAVEGAVANLTANKHAKVFNTPTIIPNGNKIQYTLAGVTGTGTILLHVRYQSMVSGAVLA